MFLHVTGSLILLFIWRVIFGLQEWNILWIQILWWLTENRKNLPQRKIPTRMFLPKRKKPNQVCFYFVFTFVLDPKPQTPNTDIKNVFRTPNPKPQKTQNPLQKKTTHVHYQNTPDKVWTQNCSLKSKTPNPKHQQKPQTPKTQKQQHFVDPKKNEEQSLKKIKFLFFPKNFQWNNHLSKKKNKKKKKTKNMFLEKHPKKYSEPQTHKPHQTPKPQTKSKNSGNFWWYGFNLMKVWV